MNNAEPNRMGALGALLVLVVTCALAVAGTVCMYARAVHDLAEQHALLSNLQHLARAGNAVEVASAVNVPASALVESPTQGIAGAQLQGYLSQLVAAQHGTLISAGVQSPARSDDAAESIRVLATLDVSSVSLQALLHRLETGVPYVFIDALTVQAPGLVQGNDDPALRVTLTVRALWRRPQA
jgi:general secretion pathway protein M